MAASNPLKGHHDTLSGEERFVLCTEVMARGDRAEARRMDDACPWVTYRCEDEQYRGRMRRLDVLALVTALALRERLTILRAAAGPAHAAGPSASRRSGG